MIAASIPTWEPGSEAGAIFDRFSRVASLIPDHDAVRSRGHVITYRQLYAAAASLGRVIGAAAGDRAPVALAFGHDTPVIVAILAAVGSGRPYTVLDPAVPSARHRLILADLNPAAVITSARHQAFAAELAGPGRPVITVDNGRTADAAAPSAAPGGDTIAGIYYTSGSTGAPKGVIRTHRTILHRVALDSQFAHFGPDDVMSLLYSASFGTSVNDIFTALLNGATLSMLELRDVGAGGLARWLEDEGITVLHLPVDVARRLLETLDADRVFPALRMVIPSGRIYRRDAERLRRHLPRGAQIISRYASTETSLVCRLALTHDTDLSGEIVPVGRPVGDKTVELVGEGGRPVPPGSVGEFRVTSRYLSPGYWGDSGVRSHGSSVARSPDDPVAYRTGDLGRLRADGLFEFVGRADERVKVRGHRVELGEVTAALHRIDGVAEAAVVQDARSDEGRLLAYVVPSGEPVSADGLRAALAAELPDSMIPSGFVMIEALPLTANGRVDRQALPPPGSARPPLETPYVDPGTVTEKRIAEIWSDVLGIAPIGSNDHFLDLGGDSLTAMRIVARVLATWNVDISVRALLEQGTVAAMAALVVAAEGTGRSAAADAVLADLQAIPLSFGQQSLWLADRLGTDPAAYNMAKIIDLEGPLDIETLRWALEGLVHRHEVLRTTYHDDGINPRQVVHPPRPFSMPVIDLSPLDPSGAAAAEGEHLDRAAGAPFDLATDLMLRAALIRHRPDRHVLSLVNHHIAGDWWSTAIMLREIAAGYRSLQGDGPAPVSPLSQYCDFAAWQRQRFADQGPDRRAVTRAELLDAIDTSLDPLVPAGAVPDPTVPADRIEFVVPPQTVAALRDWAGRRGATLFMASLAALAGILRRHTARSTITIASLFSSRTRPEWEDLIGYFANLVPIALDVADGGDRTAILEAARVATLDAFLHAEVPFEHLVRQVNPVRVPGRLPMVDVLLSFGEPADDTMALGATRGRRRRRSGRVALAPIDVILRGEQAGLRGVLQFDPSLVGPDVAGSIADDLQEELNTMGRDQQSGGRP